MVWMRTGLFGAVVAAAALSLASAGGIKEPKGSKVSVLNKDLFHRFMNRNPLVLMEFYAPWCGHCQELAPKFREAASQLAARRAELPTPIKFAKLDDGDDYNREARFGAEDVYNFSSYPALFVFKDGKMDTPYYGGREVDDIVHHMTAVAKGLDPWEEEKKRRPGLYKGKTKIVAELEPEYFNTTVLSPASEDNTVWIVEFYSDQCPFCKSLSPEMIVAAETLAADGVPVRIAGINSRIFDDVAEVWGVTGWPWVACFYDGDKRADMAGLGGAQSVIDWAKRMVGENYKKEYGPMANKNIIPSTMREAAEAAPEVETPKAPPAAVNKAAPAAPAKPAEVAVAAESGEAAPADGEEDKGAVWRATLGRQTWFFIHTMAAKYPDMPSEVDMRTMRNFVASLGQHYPCKLCRRHLREKLQDPALGPVRVENRTALSVWFCDLHNMVNRDTGKPLHDCAPFGLDLQYLKDCGECEPGKSSAPGEAAIAPSDTFDARLYAKDTAQLLSEMNEAMDAMAMRIDQLEDENEKLRRAAA